MGFDIYMHALFSVHLDIHRSDFTDKKADDLFFFSFSINRLCGVFDCQSCFLKKNKVLSLRLKDTILLLYIDQNHI